VLGYIPSRPEGGLLKLPIYLDNHATTRVDPRVIEAMLPFFGEDYGNAASHNHVFGWRAEAAVEIAREELAAAIGAPDPREIIFTSGATESDNLAIKGATPEGGHVITAATEHPAVLDTCEELERRGVAVTVLPVDSKGIIDPEGVARAINERSALVSIMAANSEVGVLQPLAEIGRICRERGVLFHTDAAQAVGKIPLDVEVMGIDLLSISAHKLYGPKGIGALFARHRRPDGKRLRLLPQIHGGGHQRGLRSGTLPVPLIVGFGSAVALCVAEMDVEAGRLLRLRGRMLERLSESLAGVFLNGHPERRLPGNLNLSFQGIEADALISDLKEVAVSTGSACSSAKPQTSHVLRALGCDETRARSSIRVGLGRFTTAEEIEVATDALIAAVSAQRARRGS
jgi:cysteine desulfurase